MMFKKQWIGDEEFMAANKPEHFSELTDKKKAILLVWIMTNIEPHRTKGYHSIRNSYRLKHNFEFSEIGFYISNGQFKGAMLASGFEPRDKNELNWVFALGKNAGRPVGWRRYIPGRYGTRRFTP